jgi:hypothetical protein
MRPIKQAPCLAACALLLAWPGGARAADGDCVTSFTHHANTAGHKEYKINTGTSSWYPGTTTTKRRRAAIAAADQWNENGNAGSFRYIGSTTLTDIPDDLADCQDQGVDYSLIVFTNESDGGRGVAQGRCKNASGHATQFRIKIYAKKSDGTNWGWSVGDIAAGEYDMWQTLVHELGHTQRLGHPGDDEAALMRTTGNSQGRTRQRDVYQWDLKCSDEISGRRALSGYRRNHSVGTFIDPEVKYTGTIAATKGTVSTSTQSGTWRYNSVLGQATSFKWTDGLYATGHSFSSVNRRVATHRAIVWREASDWDRLVYSDYRDMTPYDWDSGHRVRYVRSNDGFDASRISGSWSRCSAMGGFMRCSGTTPVVSGKKVSVAWDDGVSRSVTTWVNQNRQDDVDDREVMVAVGHVNVLTLPQPTGLGVRSVISPGLACKDGAADGHDCVIAYVDPGDPYHNLKVKRFTPTAGAQRYTLSVSGWSSVGVATSSALALWYSSGKFWLAVRPAYSKQETRIYSSTNGRTWTREGTTWGYSVVGPSVASHWTGSNVLVTWK